MTIGDEKVVAEVCEDQSGSKYLCWSPGLTPLPPAGTRLYTAPPSAPVGVEADYVPGELDRTAPPRIWLQIDTSADNSERDDKWPDPDGVSWCWESIGGLEIQYVRADLAQQPAACTACNGRGEVGGATPEGFETRPCPECAQQPAAVDEVMVFRLAVWMAKNEGHDDPHHLIWEGSPPEPWGEVWNRYEDDARAALTAALAAQPGGSDNDQ